jgi:transcription antitermination factor NusG
MIGHLSTTNWYVAYTMPRAERRAAQFFNDHCDCIETFVPLHWVVRQWSDRRVKREEPLFPNYVFVKTESIPKVLSKQVPGLVRFVTLGREPVVVKDSDILAIRNIISGNVEITPRDYFQVGTRIRVNGGFFNGMEGIVEHLSGKFRLTIKIDALMKAFSINISSSAVDSLSTISSGTSSEVCGISS